MAKTEEKVETRTVSDIEILTETVASLTMAMRTQNDILLCLLHKFDLDHDLPLWTTKEGMEKDVEPKVQACIEAIRKIYGRGETNKS